MTEETLTDAVLREFLLGNVNDEEREQIENLFLTDSKLRQRVLAIEQDLIEEYLEESLTKEEKERFLSLYAQTGEQQRKLRITASIKDWALKQGRAPEATGAKGSGWSAFWLRLRLKPRVVVLIAVTIVIAIVLGIVWLNSEMERRKHSAVEQQLAQLNSPTSLREVLPGTFVLDLRPVAGRSVERPAELQMRSEIRFLELRFPWIRNERYATYQAEVRLPGSRESFTIPNLQAESHERYTIRLRLPVYMLSRGHYQINVTGIGAEGSQSFSEEYAFIVTD